MLNNNILVSVLLFSFCSPIYSLPFNTCSVLWRPLLTTSPGLPQPTVSPARGSEHRTRGQVAYHCSCRCRLQWLYFLYRSILSHSCSFHWDPITAFSLCHSRVGVVRLPIASPSLRVLHHPTFENTPCTPVTTWSVAILSVPPPHLPIETHDVQFQLVHECKMFHHLIMNHTMLPWQWHQIKDIVHFCANGFKLILECVAINLHASCLTSKWAPLLC